MTYDTWKTTNPQDQEPEWVTCPVCKFKHFSHEECLTPEPELDTMIEKTKTLRPLGNLLEDLKHSPTNSQSMNAQRAFTVCELAIYRFRDHLFTKDAREYDTLTRLGEEILELRKSWQGK